MEYKGIEVCCPACKGDLDWEDRATWQCSQCQQSYPIICDIPDLRVFPDPYIGFDADRAKGVKVDDHADSVDFEGLIDFYYSVTDVVPEQHANMYKRGLMAGEHRASKALDAWEDAANVSVPTRREKLLEIGCGTGPLLVAASNRYPKIVGVDIAFRWLAVGKKRLKEAGLEDIPIICACAEALPFPGGQFDFVVAESTIEHLRSQADALSEARRVMNMQGKLFLSTPNRYSIGPDPHTGLPAGGMLPQGVTATYVKKKGGIPPKRRLLSILSLQKLLKRAGFKNTRVFVPSVSAEQKATFSSPMKQMIGAYNVAARTPLSRQMLYLVGPLLYAVAEPDARK